MTGNGGGAFWYEGDHLEGGYTALKEFGRSRAGIWTASAGYGEAGKPQILVLHFDFIEILSEDGDLLLEAGHREIRAVRVMEHSGVQVCLSKGESSSSRPTRWLHCLSHNDARYLEQCWLDMPSFNHTGIQMDHLPWLEAEYAYYVGRVITESSRCDVALALLVSSAHTLLGQPMEKVHGSSGEQLADSVDKLGEHSLALADIGKRYRAWYGKRNFATHGIRGRDDAGRPTGQVYKAKKAHKGQPLSVAFEIENQDFRELALLCKAFNELTLDANRATMEISFGREPAQVLAHIPMPMKGDPSLRFPQDVQPERTAE